MSEPKLVKNNKAFDGIVEYYTHPSSSTNTDMNFSVFVPPQALNAKVPVLLWLSGLTCTEENFMAKAGAQRWASEKGLMIVCPDTSPRGANVKGEDESWDFGTGAGFYVNATTDPWKNYYRMYDYIVKEIPDILGAYFPADMSRMSISGHSMGGHGALTIGLKNPDMFKSLSAFSPICAPMQCPWGQKAFNGYLGNDQSLWKEYDACQLIGKATKHRPILVDQGTADEFLNDHLKTHLLIKASQKANYAVDVRMQDGYDHSYYFIATFIKNHIEFHSKHL